MSITYPETQSSRAANTPATGGGSALFPGGAANLYDRARGTRGARGGKGMPIAWIAAPVAVVVIGGAIALSLPHHAATPASHTVATTTTSAASQPLAQAAAPAPASSQTVNTAAAAPAPAPAAPVAQKTVTHTATRDAVQTTTARGGNASSNRTVTRSTTTEALPASPVPYDQTASGQGGQVAVSPQAPQTTASAPASGPTPGNFAFTAPATGPNGAQPAPAAPAAAPADQPAPQAAAQPG